MQSMHADGFACRWGGFACTTSGIAQSLQHTEWCCMQQAHMYTIAELRHLTVRSVRHQQQVALWPQRTSACQLQQLVRHSTLRHEHSIGASSFVTTLHVEALPASLPARRRADLSWVRSMGLSHQRRTDFRPPPQQLRRPLSPLNAVVMSRKPPQLHTNGAQQSALVPAQPMRCLTCAGT